MVEHPTYTKVIEGVATRKQMYALFNRVPDGAPPENLHSGAAFAGQWFEIREAEYEYMFELLPPRFIRSGMFGMSELKAGTVGSIFCEIMIEGRKRWFHGYCDFADRGSPEAMRSAIAAHETMANQTQIRAEKLDAIWANTHPDFKGIAGEANLDASPPEHRGKRTILVYEPSFGTVLKLLENLTGDEIAGMLSLCSSGSPRVSADDADVPPV
ncbi:hypothetical protein Sj15T_09820 [Sphingobium sp. TA15]|uniref:DUF1419 domain-containing protein n=1 Tax=Sphingobium indicum (strain DSM 16413 / CCM 7287 / MTCC 6362 / UT26 / NBRC 101211 / UT26S) TaxID=452662 RepID=D4Z247_SPHIU|nr:DUF1419 domain-containing protein [Sphingobium indicum]BAI96679.1 hypothetical protein SJA_C1-18450 [Sphingobium indicum UT26S]BDD65961.1 hypothetical protein Sj15T_09820 [Sphingobium sp. TA15]